MICLVRFRSIFCESSKVLLFSQELVREMSSALRQMKSDLESSDNVENKRIEYNSWNSIKDELDRVSSFFLLFLED